MGAQNYQYDSDYRGMDCEEFLDIYLDLIRKKSKLLGQPDPFIKLNKPNMKMRMEIMTTFSNLVSEV